MVHKIIQFANRWTAKKLSVWMICVWTPVIRSTAWMLLPSASAETTTICLSCVNTFIRTLLLLTLSVESMIFNPCGSLGSFDAGCMFGKEHFNDYDTSPSLVALPLWFRATEAAYPPPFGDRKVQLPLPLLRPSERIPQDSLPRPAQSRCPGEGGNLARARVERH